MATGRIPGCIGAPGRPTENVRDGTNGLFASPTPGPLGVRPTTPDFAELCSRAVGSAYWLDTQKHAVMILGPQCFSFGVAYGVGEGLVSSVLEMFQLVKMLVLADLHDALNPGTPLWMQIARDGVLWPTRQFVASYLHHHWSEPLRKAKHERDEFIATIGYLIKHPIDAMDAMKDDYVKKWREFELRKSEQSLSSQFRAGAILGGLLFEIISLIVGVVGFARAIVVAIPRIAKLVTRLRHVGIGLIRDKRIKVDAAAAREANLPLDVERASSTNRAENKANNSSEKDADYDKYFPPRIEYGKTGPNYVERKQPKKNRPSDDKAGLKPEEEKGLEPRAKKRLLTTPMQPFYIGEEIGDNPNAWWVEYGFDGPVEYFTDAERASAKLTIKDGKIYDANGKLFDTRPTSSERAIFVMDEHGNVFTSLRQQAGKIHHSSLAGGKPVAMAGEIEVFDGELRMISNSSGHYIPSDTLLMQGAVHLAEQGIDFEFIDVISVTP